MPAPMRSAKSAPPRSAPLRSAGRSESRAVDYGTLPNHVGYLLRLAQLRVWEDFYGRMNETGISPGLYSALMLIERNPGLQQSRLGEAFGVARSGAMTMVDRSVVLPTWTEKAMSSVSSYSVTAVSGASPSRW